MTERTKVMLTDEQLESLQQYANHCKMRPTDPQARDNWRNVPVSQEQFDRLASINQDWFLEVANNF